MKRKSKVLLLIVGLLILTFILGFYFYKKSLGPVDKLDQQAVILDIEEASTGYQIGKLLKEKDLIKNENVFKLYLKINAIDGLKSGQYEFTKAMSVDEIIEKLKSGGRNTHVKTFTIPEGYELKQIAEKLSSEGIVDRDLFLKEVADKSKYEEEFDFLKKIAPGQSLEGYLFPSTYEIREDADEEEIIRLMLKEFDEIYSKYIKDDEKNVQLNFNEIVTLASIIERESRRDDERNLISGVFYNRLAIDMKLQSCATVQYILGERKEVLSNKDTSIDSEFNTYRVTGLPPTPISSVSKGSLIAAVNPAEHDYLFFRTKEDGTGGHTFSKTYDDHIGAKPKK